MCVSVPISCSRTTPPMIGSSRWVVVVTRQLRHSNGQVLDVTSQFDNITASLSVPLSLVMDSLQQFSDLAFRIQYFVKWRTVTWEYAILRRPDYVLHPLLPPLKTVIYHLRKRSHDLELYAVQSSFLRKNVVYRVFIETIFNDTMNVFEYVFVHYTSILYFNVYALIYLFVIHQCR